MVCRGKEVDEGKRVDDKRSKLCGGKRFGQAVSSSYVETPVNHGSSTLKQFTPTVTSMSMPSQTQMCCLVSSKPWRNCGRIRSIALGPNHGVRRYKLRLYRSLVLFLQERLLNDLRDLCQIGKSRFRLMKLESPTSNEKRQVVAHGLIARLKTVKTRAQQVQQAQQAQLLT